MASTQSQEYQVKNEFSVITQAEATALFSRAHPCTHSQESQVIKEFRVITQAEAKAVFSGVRQCTQLMQSQRQLLGDGRGSGFGKLRKRLWRLRQRSHRLSRSLLRVGRFQGGMEELQVVRSRVPWLLKRVSSLEVATDMGRFHRSS